MEVLCFILACYGLTQILIYGTILDTIRPKQGKIAELLKCPMCLGFWVGLFNWFMFDVEFNILAAGFISSATSYALCMLFNDFGLNIKINKENKE